MSPGMLRARLGPRGRARESLDAAAAPNAARGRPGRDSVDGAATPSLARGRPGRDSVDGAATPNLARGRPGRDSVDAAAPSLARGRPGRDSVDAAASNLGRGRPGRDSVDGAAPSLARGRPGRDSVDGAAPGAAHSGGGAAGGPSAGGPPSATRPPLSGGAGGPARIQSGSAVFRTGSAGGMHILSVINLDTFLNRFRRARAPARKGWGRVGLHIPYPVPAARPQRVSASSRPMHNPPLCLHPAWRLCLSRGSPGARSTTLARARRPLFLASARAGAARSVAGLINRIADLEQQDLRSQVAAASRPQARTLPARNSTTSDTCAPTLSPAAAAVASPSPAGARRHAWPPPRAADAPARARRWRRGRAARTRPRWQAWTSCLSPSSGAQPPRARPAWRTARAPAARAAPYRLRSAKAGGLEPGRRGGAACGEAGAQFEAVASYT